MPKVGQRSVDTTGSNRKYLPQLQALKDVNDCMLSESGVSFVNGLDVLRNERASEALKDWFINESADRDSFETDGEYDDFLEMMGELYENDKIAVTEAMAIGSTNPTIGFNLLMHKNLMMNSVYKQGITNLVTVSPKFVETFQRQYLVTPDMRRLDIALEQNDLYDALVSSVPSEVIELTLPELGNTNIMEKLKGGKLDKLSIDTYISAIKFEVDPQYKTDHPELLTALPGEEEPRIKTEGGKDYIWMDVNIPFLMGAYVRDFDRTFTNVIDLEGKAAGVTPTGASAAVKSDVLNGNIKINGQQKLMITSATGLITAVKLSTKLDASLGTIEPCSTEYHTEDIPYEVPDGLPLNTTINPSMVKDINALYNMNHISVIVDSTLKILDNYKDTSIRKFLDNSYKNLADRYKVAGKFDMKPRTDYALDVVTYRKNSFMDLFESYATEMLNALNDPDMSISVYGRPDIIRRLSPTDYTYTSPNSIGPVTLDFSKGVYSSNNRNFTFLSSRKIKDNQLVAVLKPNAGNNRKTYSLYDYCFYMSSEVRNAANPALPAIHAFDRFLVTELQPVQGRIEILNPTGYDTAGYENL